MKILEKTEFAFAADGKWHTILTELDGLSAFQITGYAQGSTGTGKHSVIHSIVLNASNGKKGRIFSKCDYQGVQWWNRMKLRWRGHPNKYQLQIRTCSNYGVNGRIIVVVKNLLEDLKEI